MLYSLIPNNVIKSGSNTSRKVQWKLKGLLHRASSPASHPRPAARISLRQCRVSVRSLLLAAGAKIAWPMRIAFVIRIRPGRTGSNHKCSSISTLPPLSKNQVVRDAEIGFYQVYVSKRTETILDDKNYLYTCTPTVRDLKLLKKSPHFHL